MFCGSGDWIHSKRLNQKQQHKVVTYLFYLTLEHFIFIYGSGLIAAQKEKPPPLAGTRLNREVCCYEVD